MIHMTISQKKIQVVAIVLLLSSSVSFITVFSESNINVIDQSSKLIAEQTLKMESSYLSAFMNQTLFYDEESVALKLFITLEIDTLFPIWSGDITVIESDNNDTLFFIPVNGSKFDRSLSWNFTLENQTHNGIWNLSLYYSGSIENEYEPASTSIITFWYPGNPEIITQKVHYPIENYFLFRIVLLNVTSFMLSFHRIHIYVYQNNSQIQFQSLIPVNESFESFITIETSLLLDNISIFFTLVNNIYFEDVAVDSLILTKTDIVSYPKFGQVTGFIDPMNLRTLHLYAIVSDILKIEQVTLIINDEMSLPFNQVSENNWTLDLELDLHSEIELKIIATNEYQYTGVHILGNVSMEDIYSVLATNERSPFEGETYHRTSQLDLAPLAALLNLLILLGFIVCILLIINVYRLKKEKEGRK